MADWPADGATAWNATMKANIDVGHDSDGTHKKSQMLIDMEWSPAAYVGGESVTLPNGCIMKMGKEVTLGAQEHRTVTFGAAFPTAIITAIACLSNTPTSIDDSIAVHTVTTAKIEIESRNAIAAAYWIAIGY